MNKKIFIGIVVLSAIVTLITVNVHLSNKSTTVLDISLAQIEALADESGETGGGGGDDGGTIASWCNKRVTSSSGLRMIQVFCDEKTNSITIYPCPAATYDYMSSESDRCTVKIGS